MNQETPFVSRVRQLLAMLEDPQRLLVTPAPIAGLMELPPSTAAELLMKRLQQVYVPVTQSVALVSRMLQTGLAHAIHTYSDLATFISNTQKSAFAADDMFAEIGDSGEPRVWVATGLAGHGKSTAAAVLMRLLANPVYFQPSEHCPERPILVGLYLRIRTKTKREDILRQLAAQLGLSVDKTGSNLIRSIRMEIYRKGVMFIVLDESQAQATGTTAGASYVNVIAFVQQFGVPLVVIGNYSMLHGVFAQSSQWRQRLLNDPFLMWPMSSTDPEYVSLLKAYVAVCGGMLQIDANQDALSINLLVGGGVRALINLICQAYEAERKCFPSRDPIISLASLQAASEFPAFANFRKEAEDVREHLISNRNVRKDLRCPFELSGDDLKRRMDLVEQYRAQKVWQEKLLGGLTPQMRREISAGKREAPEFDLPPDTASIMTGRAQEPQVAKVNVKPARAASRNKRPAKSSVSLSLWSRS